MTTRRVALLNTLALLLFLATVLSVYRYASARAVDDLLRVRAETVLDHGMNSLDIEATPFAVHPVYIQINTAEGLIFARSRDLGDVSLPVESNASRLALAGQASYVNASLAGQTLREYVTPAGGGQVLTSATPINDFVQTDVPTLVARGAFGALLALIVAYLLARLVLAPIEQLVSTVRGITSTEDLSRRVPDRVATRRGAVGALALEINGMLGRLQKASERLANALEAQRRFVADASHELRTPLTSLRGNVDLLVRYLAERVLHSSRDVEGILRDMAMEAERMSRLVDDLLLLARADAEQHLLLAPTAVDRVLRRAFNTASVLAEEVELSMTLAPYEMWVEADADRLEQLMLILLDNAVRYTPKDGAVSLSAFPEERQGQPGVAIEVTDSGRGVTVEERERIFDRFYRGTASRGQPDGTGLGLAVARWLVEEHHGTIEIRDAIPCGSTFVVWLPTLSASVPTQI